VPLAAFPGSPSACRPVAPNDLTLQIIDSARSQYVTNLTPSSNIFPLVAKIIQSTVSSMPASGPLSPAASISDDTLCANLPEDSPSADHCSPTPGKAMNLSVAERAEVGWSSPASGASD
jgi:hypothetical protein